MSIEGSRGTQQYAFKVILLGDGAVGKTALIYRYMEGKFKEDYLPTIGSQIYTKTVIGREESKIKLVVWDISGQPAFNTIRPSYYRGTSAVLLAFDLTRFETFEHLEGWIDQVRRYASNPEIVVVGNKSDLEAERKVSRKSSEDYASKIKAPYVETSAKDGSNVVKAFTTLAERLAMKVPSD